MQAGQETFLADAEGAKSALPRMVKVGYKQLQLIYVRMICVSLARSLLQSAVAMHFGRTVRRAVPRPTESTT